MSLSKPILDALKVHEKHYKSFSDYSATSLIDPPRMVQLKKRHKLELKPKPESQLSSFIGTGVHKYFEECLNAYKIADWRYDLERTVYDKINDRLISGTFDILYDGSNMYDVKTCKVWKIIFDPNQTEWTQQQNIYAYLLHRRGIDVRRIHVIALFLDWQEGQAVRQRGKYPNAASVEYRLPLWDWEESHLFLTERLTIHKACEEVPDDELPECSRSERWERHEGGALVKYAVLSNKNVKRAKRVFDDANKAIDYFKKDAKLKSTALIEIRYAQRKRCEKYCSANLFCNHYIDYCGAMEEKTLNDYWTYDQIHQGRCY